MIRAPSVGPPRPRVFALRVLRIIRVKPRALQRPAVTDLLLGFASADDVDMASAALIVLMTALGKQSKLAELRPEDAAHRTSLKLRELCASLPSRLQSPHEAMVIASLQFVNRMCGTLGVRAEPWFCQCIATYRACLGAHPGRSECGDCILPVVLGWSGTPSCL